MNREGYSLQRYMHISKQILVLSIALIVICLSGLVLISCSDGSDKEPEILPETGKITFTFTHHVDQKPIQLDLMIKNLMNHHFRLSPPNILTQNT